MGLFDLFRRRSSSSTAPAASPAPSILNPNPAELRWIQENLALAQQLVQLFAPELATLTLDPHALDEAYARWFAQHRPEQEDPNPIINAVGLAYGQYMADQLSLEWTVVSDAQGTDIALHGEPNQVLIFPTALVAKRYYSRQTGFLSLLYPLMRDDVARLRAGEDPK
jgi:hypothetical protein